ncbi:hypothetical protein VNO77_27250 [Canavalia gladiata]|uniref:Uncharacterized protein n=1 Tax=Canavalia gladiata TaxID=3824 RepID=A0AAN9KUF6_CANGL
MGSRNKEIGLSSYDGKSVVKVCVDNDEAVNSEEEQHYMKNIADLTYDEIWGLEFDSEREANNANIIGSGMKNIMDEDVIPTQCSAKVVKGDDRECQAVYIPNPTTVPPPMMKTSFTSLLQNLHNLGKIGDPGHVKESPSGVENIF